MKKKYYLKPMVQVVKLKNHALLQTVSVTGGAGVQNYNWNEPVTE